LALPNDPAETFVREVDENLRRDQMRDMAKTYGKWIVAAAILFLAAVGGYLYWQNRQAEQASQESENMSAALDKAESGNVKGAVADLAPISDSSSDVNRAGARLARAALALRQNDRKTAIEICHGEARQGRPRRRRPAVRQHRGGPASAPDHPRPCGSDRRFAGRRRIGVAARHARLHSCPIGHDKYASR
jgi:hypothetical protein